MKDEKIVWFRFPCTEEKDAIVKGIENEDVVCLNDQ